MAASRSDREALPTRGQPLRFLAAVLCLWVSMRLVAASSLLPGGYTADKPQAGPAQARIQAYAANALGQIFHIGAESAKPVWTASIDRAPVSSPVRLWSRTIYRAPVARMAEIEAVSQPEAGTNPPPVDHVPTDAPASSGIASAVPVRTAENMSRQRRWSGSAWIFWREKGVATALTGAGQLGGSQAGVRLDRQVANLGRGGPPVLLYGRLTTALKAPHQSEAALGLAVRPFSGRMPLTVGVERRIALDNNARNAMAIVAAGGLNPTRIAGPVMAEGYAQAGIVGFSRRDLFADGRLTLSVPLDKARRTNAGASLSGGAQPGVSRLDIGPMVETRLPLGSIQPRLAVEWRQRIAGRARPGSGLSVTLASDF